MDDIYDFQTGQFISKGEKERRDNEYFRQVAYKLSSPRFLFDYQIEQRELQISYLNATRDQRMEKSMELMSKMPKTPPLPERFPISDYTKMHLEINKFREKYNI